MENEYLHMLINLGIVLALMGVLIVIMRKFKLAKHLGNKQMKIINSVAIGSKEKVILMEVNNTFLLLGATPNHIETLYVFDSLEEAPAVIKYQEKPVNACADPI